jgi:hypothetical protein
MDPSNASTVTGPRFNGDGFELWEQRMMDALDALSLSDAVVDTPTGKDQVAKDKRARGILAGKIADDILMDIVNERTTHALLARLRADYGVVPSQKAKTHRQGLLQRFAFDDGPLSPQLVKFDDLVRAAGLAAGRPVDPDDIVGMLLAKLPASWNAFVEAQEGAMDSAKLTPAKLKMKIREKERYTLEQHTHHAVALAAHVTPGKPGITCFGCGKQGHRQADCATFTLKSCFVCGGSGHTKIQCPSPGGGAAPIRAGRAAAAVAPEGRGDAGYNDGSGFMMLPQPLTCNTAGEATNGRGGNTRPRRQHTNGQGANTRPGRQHTNGQGARLIYYLLFFLSYSIVYLSFVRVSMLYPCRYGQRRCGKVTRFFYFYLVIW